MSRRVQAREMTRRGLVLAGLSLGCVVLIGDEVAAQGSGHGLPQPSGPAGLSQDEKFRRRFPQPVLVSDLIGRQVLDRDQGVLGRIVTLENAPSGQVQIVFSKRSLFGYGGPTVAIPANVAALLGQFVMVLDLSEEQIDKLPAWTAGSASPVDRNARIQMALTKH